MRTPSFPASFSSHTLKCFYSLREKQLIYPHSFCKTQPTINKGFFKAIFERVFSAPLFFDSNEKSLTCYVIHNINSFMIKSFACKETEKLFNDVPVRRYQSIERQARRKLLYLHSVRILQDLLQPPGNKLEPLQGNRKGQYSIRINDQWRICFKWQDGNAFDVEITDYH